MASRRTERSFAFVLSVAVHAAIVAALTFSVSLGGSQPMQQIVIPIETVMIDESAVRTEIARLEAEELARIRADEESAQRVRDEAERVRREREQEEQELARIQQEQDQAERDRVRAEVEAQARAEEEVERLRILEQRRIEEERQAEQERIAREAEAQRLEAERQRVEAERARRIAAIEAETAQAIAAEQTARAAADAGLRDQWARAISDRVTRYWIKPPNVQVGLECLIYVTQLPNGEVVNVEVNECNTSDANIIRSIENAVLNASPLPQRPRGVEFESLVRIRFIPEE